MICIGIYRALKYGGIAKVDFPDPQNASIEGKIIYVGADIDKITQAWKTNSLANVEPPLTEYLKELVVKDLFQCF
jgi:hypothetical protein